MLSHACQLIADDISARILGDTELLPGSQPTAATPNLERSGEAQRKGSGKKRRRASLRTIADDVKDLVYHFCVILRATVWIAVATRFSPTATFKGLIHIETLKLWLVFCCTVAGCVGVVIFWAFLSVINAFLPERWRIPKTCESAGCGIESRNGTIR